MSPTGATSGAGETVVLTTILNLDIFYKYFGKLTQEAAKIDLLRYKTRDGSSPQSKQKVYFCGGDRERRGDDA